MPFVLATLLFVIRVAAKTMGLGGGWGGDDFTLIVSYVCSVSQCMGWLRVVYTDCADIIGWWLRSVFVEYVFFFFPSSV